MSRRRRTQMGESIHDRVIGAVAAAQRGHDTYTNPGPQHNYWLTIGQDVIYPDLLLCTPRTRTVEHLIEVETEDSVDLAESEQWAQYSRGPGSFWLLVPAASLSTALQICRRQGIAARFGRWWIDRQRIGFEWLRTG